MTQKSWREEGDRATAAGKLADALAAYGKALEAEPGDVMARVNRGVAFQMLGRPHDAARDYAKAAELVPGHALIQNNLAAALLDCDRLADAEAAARAALAADPAMPGAWNNLGIALGRQKRTRDAREAWNRALAIAPDHPTALVSLAQSLRSEDPDKAGDLFERVLALAPDNHFAYAEAVSTLWNACRWDRARALLGDLDRRLALGMPAQALYVLAFVLPYIADDPLPTKKVRTALGRALAAMTKPMARPAPKAAAARIAIGYLSPDFGNHAMSHVLRSFMPAHDRDAFEIVLFSLRDRSGEAGPWLGELKAAASSFVDLSALDSATAASVIRSRGIDILVDLCGYSAGGRLEILAARPAPVQVYWIGHAGFMEAPFIDYTLCDPVVAPEPPGSRQHVEALARLPACYHPADRYPLSRVPTRAELGLPENGIVFCAFCNPLKIDPVCFAAWMEILVRVPGSVLWLSERPSYIAAQALLRARATEAGVAPERLVFAPHALDKAAHLARHRAADFFLDSFAVSAASTALDALGAGLPVLTKRGRQAHANVAVSFLTALGLPELIAGDRADFVERAVALAQDAPRLAALREKLAQAVATRVPFEPKPLARQVESAYRQMAARARAGLAPADFDVEDPPA